LKTEPSRIEGNGNWTRYEFLDGLRGWAALNVMILHVFFGSLPAIDSESLPIWAWWPFTGVFSVGIFFVVSGFALSVAFLQDNDRKRLLRMAGGRYVRLMVPIFATCALVSFFLNTGIIPAPDTRLPAYATSYGFDPTVGHLAWFSIWAVFFNFDFVNTYAGPLWTMSYELVASYSLFVLMLACRPAILRRPVCLGFGLSLLAMDSVYCWFFFGMSAAELYLWLQRRPNMSRYAVWIGWGLLAAGYCFPLDGLGGGSRAVMTGVTLWFLGTMLLPPMRSFMSSRFSLFLGKISFPLYLVHESMIVAVGGRIYVGASSAWTMLLADLATVATSLLLAMAFVQVDNLGKVLSRKTGKLFEKAVNAVRIRLSFSEAAS
jgi:peptidoglycan/LPS O-acetylase OafA/YrhL